MSTQPDRDSAPTDGREAVSPNWLDDGFGNLWERCGDDCDLEIVRPGKVQCSGGPCGMNDRDTFRVGWDHE